MERVNSFPRSGVGTWKDKTSANVPGSWRHPTVPVPARLLSPPRPEFDSEETDEPAGNDADEPLLAAVDLCVAAHFRFKQHRTVAKPGDDGDTALVSPVCLFVCDRRNGGHDAFKIFLGECLRLQENTLSRRYVGDLLFRNCDFGFDVLQLVHLGNEVSLVHVLSDLLPQLVR